MITRSDIFYPYYKFINYSESFFIILEYLNAGSGTRYLSDINIYNNLYESEIYNSVEKELKNFLFLMSALKHKKYLYKILDFLLKKHQQRKPQIIHLDDGFIEIDNISYIKTIHSKKEKFNIILKKIMRELL